MSSWLNGLSREEIKEMIEDVCTAFNNMVITEDELRTSLAKLGLNATDIQELVEQNRP
jgi:predicted PilT family ATPase